MTENIHDIMNRIDEELIASGNIYSDESVRYMITGELTPNDSEKKLINDVVFLLRKIQMLKDVLELSIRDNENMMNSIRYRQKQTTIDDHYKDVETLEAK